MRWPRASGSRRRACCAGSGITRKPTAPSPSRRVAARRWSRSTRSGTSSKKSRKLWIWKAFERGTGRLIDGECGGRDQGTLDRLLKRLERWGVRLFCTDAYAPDDEALPVGRHYIEGSDATQRKQQLTPAALVCPF